METKPWREFQEGICHIWYKIRVTTIWQAADGDELGFFFFFLLRTLTPSWNPMRAHTSWRDPLSSSVSGSASSVRLKMQETVPYCRTAISLKPFFFFSWRTMLDFVDRNANRKAGSQPSHRLGLFSHNDAGGIITRTLQPGKSIKLSAGEKSRKTAVHISPV